MTLVRRRRMRGAAYVELIIAIMPMLILFWGLMQLNGLLLADLVVRHAATHAVRAAIVCDSDDAPQSGDELAAPQGCSYEAAKMTLSAIKSFAPPGGSEPTFSMQVSGASRDGNAPVTVTLNADYYCQVPLASFVCGFASAGTPRGDRMRVALLTRKATLPNQGAGYAFGHSSSTQ